MAWNNRQASGTSTIETSSTTRMSAFDGIQGIAGIGMAVEAEQPVNGAGLMAHDLFEPLGRLAGGRGQNHDLAPGASAMLVMVETAYVFPLPAPPVIREME